MRMKLFYIILCCLGLNIAQAQIGKAPRGNGIYTPAEINPVIREKLKAQIQVPETRSAKQFNPVPISPLLPTAGISTIKELNIGGYPVWVEGELMKNGIELRNNLTDLSFTFFEANRQILKITQPREELALTNTIKDPDGTEHFRFSQRYKGLEIWDSEVMLHYKDGKAYLFNGRYIPTPTSDFNTTPVITQAQAEETARTSTGYTPLSAAQMELIKGDEQLTSQLIIYTEMDRTLKGTLAWKVELYPNVKDHYTIIISAANGEILKSLRHTCHFHSAVHEHGCHRPEAAAINPPLDGPATATANDLNNVPRTVYSYQVGSNYYLMNATKSMFNAAQSDMPEEPVGVIWTLNANNTSVENENFSISHIASASNNWNSNPNAVSAQYNANVAFDYFKNTFNRNSIDGVGGNVISIINVTESDGTGMDNAFWNGKAMFYGNGNRAFKPLAGGLDVGAHEMSHGVIQATANLTYENESGALNESFADIFAVLIDREDYNLGEDIVNRSVFPSGAMRSMSNPHNGGSSLGDNGWQPAHMSEKYTGTQDNGGVHINSGIVNFAFYKVASALGKGDAEKIYYNALTKYLTKSSQFIDCRNAVIQATKDLYGNDAAKIAIIERAYNEVGIGAGPGTTDPKEYEDNKGQDVVLFTNANQTNVEIKLVAANQDKVITNQTGIISRPSVTDNGNFAVFVGSDRDVYVVQFDWSNQTGEVFRLFNNNTTPFRNVAISKKGDLIALIVDNTDPIIHILDLEKEEIKEFRLYNPTTGTETYTSDVEYADAIEFDHSGSHVMYDASNQIGLAGTSYWDIGFMRVFNPGSKSWGDGKIEKLFSSLPEKTSVGNPTFSKNSPEIIALDYVDEIQQTYYLVGADVERGNTGLIFENREINYPNYSKDDRNIIFNARNQSNGRVIGVQQLNANKIEWDGSDPFVFIDDASLGNWFGTGQRNLANNGVNTLADEIGVYPNLVSNLANISWHTKTGGEAQIDIYDTNGRRIRSVSYNLNAGSNEIKLQVNELVNGVYLLNCSIGGASKTIRMIKN